MNIEGDLSLKLSMSRKKTPSTSLNKFRWSHSSVASWRSSASWTKFIIQTPCKSENRKEFADSPRRSTVAVKTSSIRTAGEMKRLPTYAWLRGNVTPAVYNPQQPRASRINDSLLTCRWSSLQNSVPFPVVLLYLTFSLEIANWYPTCIIIDGLEVGLKVNWLSDWYMYRGQRSNPDGVKNENHSKSKSSKNEDFEFLIK